MYEIGEEEIAAVARVIRGGQLFRYRGGEGGETDRFEKRMAELLGVKHFLAVTSGTSALTCGLAGMGIGPGDEVLVPAYTWLASPAAVLTVGAIPVLVDCDETLTIATADIERKIGPRTKAILPVHMAGQPCDMAGIMAIATKHRLQVIEDACQAVGGSYRGQRVAAIGTAGAFSFNQFKNISCGEGGGLATNDATVYQRALMQHDLGSNFRAYVKDINEPFFLGTTCRFNEILGAVMNVQLDRLDGILARLRARKAWFFAALRPHPLYRPMPSHDAAGDCGKNHGLTFATRAARERFTAEFKRLAPDVAISSPIDSGIHVYTNWATLIEQRAAHHPLMNPYRHPANQGFRPVTKDDCPKTLENLARTVYLPVDIKKDQAWFERVADIVQRAAGLA